MWKMRHREVDNLPKIAERINCVKQDFDPGNLVPGSALLITILIYLRQRNRMFILDKKDKAANDGSDHSQTFSGTYYT